VEKPRTAKEVKALVDGWLNEPAFAERMLGAALQMQAIPYEAWPDIFKRWETEGRPVLPSFAPYATYVMSVGRAEIMCSRAARRLRCRACGNARCTATTRTQSESDRFTTDGTLLRSGSRSLSEDPYVHRPPWW
jgi:hypothetical protein